MPRATRWTRINLCHARPPTIRVSMVSATACHPRSPSQPWHTHATPRARTRSRGPGRDGIVAPVTRRQSTSDQGGRSLAPSEEEVAIDLQHLQAARHRSRPRTSDARDHRRRAAPPHRAGWVRTRRVVAGRARAGITLEIGAPPCGPRPSLQRQRGSSDSARVAPAAPPCGGGPRHALRRRASTPKRERAARGRGRAPGVRAAVARRAAEKISAIRRPPSNCSPSSQPSGSRPTRRSTRGFTSRWRPPAAIRSFFR